MTTIGSFHRGIRATTCRTAIAAVLIARAAYPLAAADPGLPNVSNDEHRNRTDYTRIHRAYAALAMRFEPIGDSEVDGASYVARGAGYSVLLEPTRARLSLRRGGGHSKQRAALGPLETGDEVVLGMRLLGANHHAAAVASNKLDGTVNHFFGNVPSAWRPNVPTFGRITYRDVYPRIDVVYYGTQSHLEYDFVIRPGGDYRNIAFSFEGVERVDIDERGDVLLTVDGVTIVQRTPVVYQDVDGRRRYIDARYVSRGTRRVGFHVGPHDPSAALVIDPILGFSTYVGGPGGEAAAAIALDDSGNIYLTGETTSNEGTGDAFVAKLAADGQSLIYWTYLGGTVAAVPGGSPHDRATGIAVDTNGNAFVSGITFSMNFPVSSGALQASLHGVSDAFVAELDSNGIMVYSTYLGGKDQELGFGVGVDGSGRAYVTGMTMSADFPIASAFQPTFGGSPLYASSDGISNWMSIEAGLASRWVWSLAVDPSTPGTLYAGTYGDGLFKSMDSGTTWNPMNAGLTSSYVYTIAIDPSSSSIYLGTASGVFKSTDGGANWTRVGFEGAEVTAALVTASDVGAVYVAIGNPSDVFKSTDGGQTWNPTHLDDSIATLAADPTSPSVIYAGGPNGVYTSHTGGAGWHRVLIDDVHALVVDPTNPSVVYAGALQGVFKSVDGGASWSQTSLAGSRVEALGILWATNAGGGTAVYAGLEQGMFVSLDQGATWASAGLSAPAVRVIAAGPAPSPVYAGTYTGADAFVTKLNAAGSAIVYSTLLGGAGWDTAHGIAINEDGSAYVTGTTDSNDFPTAAAVQAQRGGSDGGDVFATKLDPNGGLAYSTYLGGASHEDEPAIAVDAAGRAYVAGQTFSDDFPTTSSFQASRQGHVDVFLAALDATGEHFVYSTYFGGNGQDSDPAIAVDGYGIAHLTGTTYSSNLPVLGALQPSYAGGGDGFVAAFTGSGSIVFSTYLGGSGSDAGHAIAVSSGDTVHVAGQTSSNDFPTRNPLALLSGGSDGFVAALVRGDPDLIAPTSTIVPHGTPGDNGWFRSDATVEIAATDNTGGSGVASIEFSLDGGIFQPYLAPFTISTEGTTEVRARATDIADNVETPPVTVFVGIDRSSPLLNVVVPREGNHLHSEPLSIDFTASDTVSGLVPGSLTAALDGTAVADGQTIAPLSLSLGDHTFVFAASDAAGNHSQQQIVFHVIATLDSLKAAVGLLTQQGQIEQKLSGSLMSKLDEASRAQARGNRTVARNKLTEFINQVQAQSGKSIAPNAAQVLIGDATYVLAAL